MPNVFLSHSSKNNRFAKRLAFDLMRHNIDVWIDEAELQIGDSLIEKIGDAIDEVDYLLVILSPQSVESKWVKREIEIALNQEILGKSIKVLPILWKPCSLPPFLRGKLFADISTPSRYKKNFYRLIRTLTGKEEAEARLYDIIPDKAQIHNLDKSFVSNYFLDLFTAAENPSNREDIAWIKAYHTIFKAIEGGEIHMYREIVWDRERENVVISYRVHPLSVGIQDWPDQTSIGFAEKEAKLLFYKSEADVLWLAPTGKASLELLIDWIYKPKSDGE